MFVFLSLLALFLVVIHILFNYNEKARLLNKIQGPKGYFIVGNAPEIVVSTVELMKLARVWSEKWKGIYKFWAYPLGIVSIYNPEDIETVISSLKFNDKSMTYSFLSPWLRQGLLISKETAMGTKLSEEVSGAGKMYKEAVHDLGKVFLHRFTRLYLFNDFMFSLSSASKMMRKYLRIVHNFTETVINDRREYIDKYGIKLPEENDTDNVVYKQKRKTAMLDLLLLAEREGHIDTVGIQEEVDTFMFGGYDTTASVLTFCLLSLANNKTVQDKVYLELQEIFEESPRPATVEDLSRMKYLEMCIKESLRLYPPVHFISRHLHETVVLSGHEVPGNVICNVNILDLHRSPHLYKDPLVFDPDRFLPENIAARHPYAYIPFSAGPRNCIGQKFAMMEMKVAVAEILRKFALTPVTRHEDIEFTADLVLRNTRPVYVTFVKR